MGKRLRTWFRKFFWKDFWGDWRGADEAWEPVRHTAVTTDAFDELDMLNAFDRIIAELEAEPKWLADFKAETLGMQLRNKWNHRYSQLTEQTGNYTVTELRALRYKLAIA